MFTYVHFDVEVTFVTMAKAPLLHQSYQTLPLGKFLSRLRHQIRGCVTKRGVGSPTVGLCHQTRGCVTKRGVASLKVEWRHQTRGSVTKGRVAYTSGRVTSLNAWLHHQKRGGGGVGISFRRLETNSTTLSLCKQLLPVSGFELSISRSGVQCHPHLSSPPSRRMGRRGRG